MKITRIPNNNWDTQTYQDIPDTTIRDAVTKYGHSEDTIELYDNNNKLIGRAIWPTGSKCYLYSYGKLLDPNPQWCQYIY